MKFENFYKHPAPWRRSKIIREDLQKTEYFKTGDVTLSTLFREVHLLPRSYKIPDDKPPFLTPKRGNYEFPQANEKYMTKIGKLMLKKRRKEVENYNRNYTS